MNFRQIKAIEAKNKNKIKAICPQAKDESGIYVLTREQDGFKFAYVGQAKRVLARLAQHLRGYQHIDLSIRKHDFWSKSNPNGYKIQCYYFPISELNEKEQEFIKLMANKGYQLRNKTAGGQGEGSYAIAEQKPAKSYRDGLKQGYENARRDVAKWFERLEVNYDDTKKIAIRYFERFTDFLKGE